MKWGKLPLTRMPMPLLFVWRKNEQIIYWLFFKNLQKDKNGLNIFEGMHEFFMEQSLTVHKISASGNEKPFQGTEKRLRRYWRADFTIENPGEKFERVPTTQAVVAVAP